MIFIGFILGFVGYLPLGNINMTVVQMAVSDTKTRLWSFILFAAVMEFVYCFVCMAGLQALLASPQLVIILNWSAVLIFLALGIYSFLPSTKDDGPDNNSVAGRGVLVAILNPLQIPFWMIWGVIVMDNDWVKQDYVSIAIFSFLCSLGTIAVLWLYAEAGKKLVERLKVNRNLLNRFIGGLLLILAIYQTAKNLHWL